MCIAKAQQANCAARLFTEERPPPASETARDTPDQTKPKPKWPKQAPQPAASPATTHDSLLSSLGEVAVDSRRMDVSDSAATASCAKQLRKDVCHRCITSVVAAATACAMRCLQDRRWQGKPRRASWSKASTGKERESRGRADKDPNLQSSDSQSASASPLAPGGKPASWLP